MLRDMDGRKLIVAAALALALAVLPSTVRDAREGIQGISRDPASLSRGSPSSSPNASHAPVVAAVGDMVCNRGTKEGPNRAPKYGLCDSMAVSDIVVDGSYDAFFALGDEQYLRGSYQHFTGYYDPSYGRVKDITYPILGNHEHYTPGAAGYFEYFGPRAHPPTGYYSFDIGKWHVIALDTQLCKNKIWYRRTGMVYNLPGWGCKANSPQYQWLQQDLEANGDAACTMALMHHPMYKWSYWPIRKDHRIQKPFLKLLQQNGADVVLAGHWHDYQRFEPMNARGKTDPNGMAEFIVGTGGDTYSPLPTKMPKPVGLAVAHDGSYGVLQMTLHPESYDWQFVTAAGEPAFRDSGSAQCH